MHTTIEEPEVSRHKCLVYEGPPSAQLSVVIPLLEEGLHDNWRCVYWASPDLVHMAESALRHKGIDTELHKQRKSLIFTSDRSHLSGGKFVPKKLVNAISAQIDDAVSDGYQGLCATGDMRWELGDDGNFDTLLEYEALLEQLFREKPLRGICQYHKDVLPPAAVRDALLTHRSAYIGNKLNRDNWFYLPPELILNPADKSSARHGEWMCRQIVRVENAERKRDLALQALRESESHLRLLARQLAESNRTLDRRVADRTAELELANKHLEAFSYSVSHDLRSPLAVITSSIELLKDDCQAGLGPDGLQHVSRIETSARRMNELIDGLLTLARVARADLVRAPIDLTALAGEVAAELADTDPNRSVTCSIQSGLTAEGDNVLVRAVLANLLGNAWKFTSKLRHARIEVGNIRGEANQQVFFVRDNGAGFEMRDADKLFGAFQRLHLQKEFPGTGIGLATVHKIIAKHGGRIWGEARPNQGATFFFTLNDAANEKQAQAVPPAPIEIHTWNA